MQQFQSLRRLLSLYVLTLLVMLAVYYIALYFQTSSNNQQRSVDIFDALTYEIGEYTAPTNNDIDEILSKPYFQNISYQITVIRPSGKTHIHQQLRPHETEFNSFGFPTTFSTDTSYQLTNHSLMGIVDNTSGYQYYVILRHNKMNNDWISYQYWLPIMTAIILLILTLLYLLKRQANWDELLRYTDNLSGDAKEAYTPPSFVSKNSTTEFLRLGHALSRVKYQLHSNYRRIKTLKHRLERMVDHAPLPMMMISRQGQINFFNQRFEQVFTTSFQRDVDYTLTDFMTGVDKTTQQLLLNLSSQRVSRTLLVCSLENKQAYQLHITPWFSEHAQVRGFTGVLSNVNDLITQNDNLTIQNQKLDLQAKEFIKLRSVIGHELRTPLNAIIGTLDLIEADNLSANQRQILTTLIQSSHSMLTMLNDMLDMAKLEAGRVDIVTESVDIFKLGEHVSDLMIGRARGQNIDLLYCFAPNCPRYITTDNSRLCQILLNLMDNAVKFTDSGYVALTIEPISQEQMITICQKNSTHSQYSKSITNRLKNYCEDDSQYQWICFSVKDSGIGIANDEQYKLFSFFNQANPQISQNFGGTGLGLAISNSFALLLGGFIQLDSDSGQGSTFNLYLPCREPLYQPVYHSHSSLNRIHLIAIVKHELYTEYLQRIGEHLSITVTTYTHFDSDSLRQFEKLMSSAQQHLSPVLLINSEFYSLDSHSRAEPLQSSLQEANDHLDLEDDLRTQESSHSVGDLQTLKDIIDSATLSKILLSRKPERSISGIILDKFDGFLNQPVNMTLLLSELIRLAQPTILDVTVLSDNVYRNQLDQQNVSRQYSRIKESDETASQEIKQLQKLSNNIETLLILVVEDNLTNQKITCKLLAKLGYESIVANNGEEALALLESKRQEINLILMDCRMPIMDGLEATKAIRAGGDNIPIIALTANNTEDDRQTCYAAGMNDFLAKPIQRQQLLTVLEHFIN